MAGGGRLGRRAALLDTPWDAALFLPSTRRYTSRPAASAILPQRTTPLRVRWVSTSASSSSGTQGNRVVPPAPVHPRPASKAFISDSTHPHFNLSLEHYLLRTRPPNEPVCLLYRNAPCIVLGRNQNPWHELDVARMRELNIRLVRRRSGGGAVYHDLGNTNYSFHIAREQFTRRAHAELVARALNSPPVALTAAASTDVGDAGRGAYVNGRNDICIAIRPPAGPTAQDAFQGERKISGSAYKITSARAYHHGTMLLTSNLGNLGSALRPSRTTMTTKGVASVSSPVSNLVDAFPSRASHLNHEAFCASVIGEFRRGFAEATANPGDPVNVVRLDETNFHDKLGGDAKSELLAGWREMDSWDWIWGQTPEFNHTVQSAECLVPRGAAADAPDDDGGGGSGALTPLPAFTLHLHVKHGVIQSANLAETATSDPDLEAVIACLAGERYDMFANAPETYSHEGKTRLSDAAQSVEAGRGLSALYRLGEEGTARQTSLARSLLVWLKSVL